MRLQKCKEEHEDEIEQVKISVRKCIETEHLAKFEAVSKQIQTIHKTELDTLRLKMEEQNRNKINEIIHEYNAKINALQQTLLDIQESQKLEIQELKMKHEVEMIPKMTLFCCC